MSIKEQNDLSKFPRPRLTKEDYELFSTLAQAVGVFKSHDLPNANCDGCIVSPRKEKGKRKIRFIFAIAYGRVMDIGIDLDEIVKNPKMYFEQLLEHINEAYKEAKRQFDTNIHILSGNKLSQAVEAVTKTVH